MSASENGGSTARRAVEALGSELQGTWEIFGQQFVHNEIHYVGHRVEQIRGPIELEGVGIRLFRPREGITGIGDGATNDLRPEALARAVRAAELGTRHSSFPVPSVDLPDGSAALRAVQNVDAMVRDEPLEGAKAFGEALLEQFPEGTTEVPSFGSVRLTYAMRSIVNSAGADREEPSTLVEFEWAVKSSGGPEGRPAGEYWINGRAARLDPDSLGVDVPRWCQIARDVRTAEPPSGGLYKVVLPPTVLYDIVPVVLGAKLSGGAERRKLDYPVGTQVASPALDIADAPHLAWATHSMTFDDEGSATAGGPLLEKGTVKRHVYDVLNGKALGHPATGNMFRLNRFGENWFRFVDPPSGQPLNTVVRLGDGGSDEELIEAAGDGIWLEQMGYAFPDPTSGSYGGEIRIAYRIRNGKLAEPLRGGTIGGLVLASDGTASLMGNVTSVGSEPRLVASFSSPSWLVGNVPISGPE